MENIRPLWLAASALREPAKSSDQSPKSTNSKQPTTPNLTTYLVYMKANNDHEESGMLTITCENYC